MRKNMIFVILLFLYRLSFSQDVNQFISLFQQYNQIRPIEKLYLHLDKPYYVAGDYMYMRAYLTNIHLNTNTLSNIIYVELSDSKKQIIKRTLLYSDKKEFAGQILLPDSLPSANYHLRAYTNWMRNAGEDYYYHRDIYIGKNPVKDPANKDAFDYQISLFPEGGYLIADTENRVSFKALAKDGFGTDITGVLKDDLGNQILTVKSSHLGMGRFNFVPQKDRTYFFTTTSNGVEKDTPLPKTTDDGHILSISQSKDSLYLNIKSAELSAEPIWIIGQSRQTICYAMQGFLNTKDESIILAKNKFPTGIAQFTLFRNGFPLSERLIFIDRGDALTIEITPDKENYGDREKARLTIQVTDEKGNPVEGSFSLAVTDDKVVTPSIGRFNIKGGLLLEADLKGYIEEPGWYFVNNEPERENALDILLSTQGWSRFSWDEIKTNTERPIYPPEEEFQITGKLTNMLGRPMKDGAVIFFSNVKTDLPQTAISDEKGRFGFIGFTNPDSTVIVLQGRSKGGRRTFLDIKLDQPNRKAFLSATPKTKRFVYTKRDTDKPTVEFMKQSTRHKKYDNNIWTIDLPEVKVITEKMKQEKDNFLKKNVFSKKLSREELNDANPIYYEMQKLSLKKDAPMMLILDEVRIDVVDKSWLDFLKLTPASHFESVELVSGTGTSMWGAMGGNVNIFILKTRLYDAPTDRPTPGLIIHKTEGYCVRKEFYVPDYDNPETKNNTTPDLRTTIYWNPIIHTDAEGKASVEFFTADNVKSYSYIVEGIGQNKIGF